MENPDCNYPDVSKRGYHLQAPYQWNGHTEHETPTLVVTGRCDRLLWSLLLCKRQGFNVGRTMLRAYCISAKMIVGLNTRDDASSSLTEPLRLSTIYLSHTMLRNIYANACTLFTWSKIHPQCRTCEFCARHDTTSYNQAPVSVMYPKRLEICILKIGLPPSVILLPL